MRSCVACRTSGDKRNLVRVVRTASGEVLVDSTGKMPGRGAYLCPSAECLRKALKEKRLTRALRSEIPDEVVRLLEKTVQQGSEDM
ncbi:MAG: YlxR family protein [Armatimonadetes bacterium]|nr:YlxR family protein [Armatimonadota bacterium]